MTKDNLLLISLKFLAAISVFSLLFILYFLVSESLPALNTLSLSRFFTDDNWYPTEGEFLLLPMIFGSLAIMLGAMLFSIPVGILTAVFSQFYAPKWISISLNRIIEILSGIPSVIYGFWGIMIIVPLLAQLEAPGTSLLAGIIVLSLIVLPTIVLVANNALSQIDSLYLDNALALGLSRYSIIRYIIFPQAKRGLFTGVILQSGRAIGETLAVLMVCGNVVQFPGSLFEPVRTLTSNIALEMAYAMDTHRSALFLSGLILMLIVVLIILLSEKLKTASRELQ